MTAPHRSSGRLAPEDAPHWRAGARLAVFDERGQALARGEISGRRALSEAGYLDEASVGPAVDLEVLAGDVVGPRRAKEGAGVSDFFRPAEATRWDGARQFSSGGALVDASETGQGPCHPLKAIRVDLLGEKTVHCDAVGGDLPCQGLAK